MKYKLLISISLWNSPNDLLVNNYSPMAKLILSNNYSTIFTEPEENNCFSIIAQVIIRATLFCFISLALSLKTSRNRILKVSYSASVL